MTKRVLGVLAGRDMSPHTLRRWADGADVILAADGGADRLLEAGVRPKVVVGDLDSMSAKAGDTAGEVVRIADQESTDCDKLLAMAAERGYDSVTLACVEGDALDHVLATLYSALRSALTVRLALRTGIAWVVRTGSPPEPARLTVETKPGR